jgi:hypothetical protein
MIPACRSQALRKSVTIRAPHCGAPKQCRALPAASARWLFAAAAIRWSANLATRVLQKFGQVPDDLAGL